jgi:hypothetical protein
VDRAGRGATISLPDALGARELAELAQLQDFERALAQQHHRCDDDYVRAFQEAATALTD